MLKYTATKQPEPGEMDSSGLLLYPYLPSSQLIEAVNLAIYLERPLLLKGDPGCGKTQLARAVAYELDLPLEAWYVKSTSQAQDGLYTYDAIGRLRDAQLAASKIDDEAAMRVTQPEVYVNWGPLGQAFHNEKRTIILIDEIDKADIDFPNDLLLELDELRFIVNEVGRDSLIREIRAKKPPIVFITSNDEKALPDAFMRRCLFHYIEFPSDEKLVEIISILFPSAPNLLTNKAVERFLKLRKEMTLKRSGKMVSTSELIDWFRVLQQFPEDEILAKLDGKLPFAGVLLKSWEDHRRYLTQVK